MATYTKTEASEKAIDLASQALGAGWLKPESANSYGSPAQAGQASAEYLGAFIKQLVQELESL
ncbi:hypothetical protein [Burkholderia gladioli]|uniref:hypothetical protein n=1 Tax=Burkholderia gladioli TaxID=28095 RepID=UPI001640222F|nr:hypothetical protein [Burkholderia gladioli]